MFSVTVYMHRIQSLLGRHTTFIGCRPIDLHHQHGAYSAQTVSALSCCCALQLSPAPFAFTNFFSFFCRYWPERKSPTQCWRLSSYLECAICHITCSCCGFTSSEYIALYSALFVRSFVRMIGSNYRY